jgi:hypothetical protein
MISEQHGGSTINAGILCALMRMRAGWRIAPLLGPAHVRGSAERDFVAPAAAPLAMARGQPDCFGDAFGGACGATFGVPSQ